MNGGRTISPVMEYDWLVELGVTWWLSWCLDNPWYGFIFCCYHGLIPGDNDLLMVELGGRLEV